MQKPCNFCDNQQEINLEKNDSTGKWVATNLDGSIHKHVKYGGAGQQTVTSHEEQQQQQQQRMTGDTSSPGRETREQAIERMHNENIKAIENLTKAINNLAEKWTGTAT